MIWFGSYAIEVMYPHDIVDLAKLADDRSGKHLGLYANGLLVAVVSVFIEKDELQFRKLATLPEHQGRGYASALLEQVFHLAKEEKCNRIWCNARETATGLYLKHGMKRTNKTFSKNEHFYIIMEKYFF